VHHGHTVKEGVDFVWHPLTAEQYAALSPVNKVRHRVEWSWAGSGLYYLRDVWWNKMISFSPPARWRKKIIWDRVSLMSVAGAAALLVGGLGWMHYDSAVGAVWMVVKLLVVPFLLFNHIIGWTVHVHHIDPDIRWYKRSEWNKFKAQVEGTTVLHARKWANLVIHNIFVHVPHHVDMRIPYYHLPRAAEGIKRAFPTSIVERRLRIRDHFRNTKQCKLYDFDEHRWLTYEEGHRKVAASSRAA
jgi:omega-6 fatty acid desaturase (delta-12 desaturase)